MLFLRVLAFLNNLSFIKNFVVIICVFYCTSQFNKHIFFIFFHIILWTTAIIIFILNKFCLSRKEILFFSGKTHLMLTFIIELFFRFFIRILVVKIGNIAIKLSRHFIKNLLE